MFEFIKNQDTSDSVKQVVIPKSLYSGLIMASVVTLKLYI